MKWESFSKLNFGSFVYRFDKVNFWKWSSVSTDFPGLVRCFPFTKAEKTSAKDVTSLSLVNKIYLSFRHKSPAFTFTDWCLYLNCRSLTDQRSYNNWTSQNTFYLATSPKISYPTLLTRIHFYCLFSANNRPDPRPNSCVHPSKIVRCFDDITLKQFLIHRQRETK